MLLPLEVYLMDVTAMYHEQLAEPSFIAYGLGLFDVSNRVLSLMSDASLDFLGKDDLAISLPFTRGLFAWNQRALWSLSLQRFHFLIENSIKHY